MPALLSTRANPRGEGGRERGAFAFRRRRADVLGADARGEFFRRAELHDVEAKGEGIFRNRGRRDGNAELVPRAQRPLVVGLAARDGDNDAIGAEEIVEVDAGYGERLLVGFVANREHTGEEDHAGGVGVGESDGAVVDEGHDAIFGLRFMIFDFILRHDQK